MRKQCHTSRGRPGRRGRPGGAFFTTIDIIKMSSPRTLRGAALAAGAGSKDQDPEHGSTGRNLPAVRRPDATHAVAREDIVDPRPNWLMCDVPVVPPSHLCFLGATFFADRADLESSGKVPGNELECAMH